MLLSIIGNLLGDGDEQSTDGNDGGGNDLMGGDLSGSTSDEGLMPGANDSSSDGGDDILADGSNGGMGGMDDMDDMGGDDDLLGDDGGMGGMDDMNGEMSLDGMDGSGGDDGPSSELESRVEEIENDVGSLSSTVNTVQSENEKISDSLEEIEEDIRKLLEVYEMVTQGVNPFVEGDSLSDSFEHGSGGGGGGGAQGSGNFGGESLFDSDVEEEEDEEIDEDIANAEAEDFLDDGMDEMDDGGDDVEFDDVGMDDEFDEMDDGGDDLEFDAAEEDSSSNSSSDAAEGDLSFDELKSEYESGDADWDEGAASDDGADESEDPFAEADEGGDALELDDGADEEGEDDLFAEDAAATGTDAGDTGDAETAATIDDLEGDSTGPEPAGDIAWDDGGRPYLESIPSEYDTQFVVMDWLDYLVSEAGLNGAARTIKFYESIRWVSSPVEEHLQTTLNGFGGGPDVEEPEPRSALGVNHKRSLWRISQIKTPEKERTPFDEWLAQEGLDGLEGDVADADGDAADEDGELSIDIDGPEDATDDLEVDAVDDEDGDEDADVEADADAADIADPGTASDSVTDTDTDGGSGEELVYTAVDDVDGSGSDRIETEADASTDATADVHTNDPQRAADDESGDATLEDGEGETETNGAQKILIDESGSESTSEGDAGAPSSADAGRGRETAPEAVTETGTGAGTDAVWTDDTNATVLRENRAVDDEFNADNGQMIWVDSDVVLSEAGADRYNAGGYARAADGETADRDGDDSLKPLFIPDEEGNLTIEPLQLLLVHDDETERN
ncbi:FlaD/FlaE family flagellar protein [Halopiger thermotolerans]